MSKDKLNILVAKLSEIILVTYHDTLLFYITK